MVDYLFMFDVDMIVEGMFFELILDVYYVLIGDGFMWKLLLIMKIGLFWLYKGVCYLYLVCL